MGARVKNKQHVIPDLLLKLEIVPPVTVLIDTFHFNETVDRFAIFLGVSRVRNFGSVFEESVIVTH